MTANYGILRVQPVKRGQGGNSGAYGLAKHHLRESSPANAQKDAPRPLIACGFAETSAEVAKRIKAAIDAHNATGRKLQKNSPVALDIFIGMSKSRGSANDESYFEDAMRWIQQKYGKENILMAAIHRDETTPHMQCLVMPRINGRFAASRVLGDRSDFQAMQDDFHHNVSSKHRLSRGLRGSKAQHVDVKRFYAALNKDPNLPKPVPVPASPGFLDRVLKPAQAAELQARRDAAIEHNKKRRERIEELAGVGQRVHPEIIRREAEIYRKTVNEREALELRVTRAQAEERLARQAAEEGKASIKEVERAAQRVTAASLRLLSQEQVDKIAKEIGAPFLELKAGRDLVDQLRKRGLCKSLSEGLEMIESSINRIAAQQHEQRQKPDYPHPKY